MTGCCSKLDSVKCAGGRCFEGNARAALKFAIKTTVPVKNNYCYVFKSNWTSIVSRYSHCRSTKYTSHVNLYYPTLLRRKQSITWYSHTRDHRSSASNVVFCHQLCALALVYLLGIPSVSSHRKAPSSDRVFPDPPFKGRDQPLFFLEENK